MSNVHRLPEPVGIAALRVLDAARRPPADGIDKNLIEALGRAIIEQDASAELLHAAEQSGQTLPLHVAEVGRFYALKAAGLFSAILSRGMYAASHERSGGVAPALKSLPGASDLVSYSDAPTLSDPCAELAPRPDLGTSAGASAQPRASARIRDNAGAPDHSDEWPTCG